jgi:hypothetical protein
MAGEERKFLHDISSPITSIQLNLENAAILLAEGTPNSFAECSKMLKACLGQARRTTEMIRERREALTKESAK